MKRFGKILCWLLALLLLAAGAFAWWQRDNLKALYQAKTMDAEEILQNAEVQREARQKELKEYDVELKAPTQEDLDALIDGKEPETVTAPPPQKETPPAKENTAKAIIEQCVQELYDCEAALMSRLGAMKQAVIGEWAALPVQERTNDKKLEIGRRGLDTCYKLEVEIDAQVQGILKKYRTELEKIHADTAPMDTLWKHYCEEKASAKAYYLNKYL